VGLERCSGIGLLGTGQYSLKIPEANGLTLIAG